MYTITRSVAKTLPWIASTVTEPSPGMPKTDSIRSDPVHSNGDAAGEDREDDAQRVEVRLAEVGNGQREPDAEHVAQHDRGHREREARPRSLAQAPRDRDAVGIAAPENEREHPNVVIGQLLGP